MTFVFQNYSKNVKSDTIPAMTLKTVHSVGRSGMTICIGIQNGGLADELQRHI